MPIPVFSVGPLQGYRQAAGAAGYAFVSHEFRAGDDGRLEHYSDGVLRAQVPPEGWAGYLEQWPEAKPLVQAMRKPSASPAIVQPVSDRQEKRRKPAVRAAKKSRAAK